MSSISYEVFLEETFNPDEWVQSVLELAASSASPDTFIQTVLTKLSLLSNDANASLDVAAHALQDALARCAAQLEGSAGEVLMLRDDVLAAAAAVDTSPTSDLHDLKMLSSAQARLSNIVQILTQSDQLHSKMQQLEAAVAQNDLQHVADTASQCRLLLSALDNLPSLHLLRARIDEATLSTRARAGSDLKAACASGDVAAGRAAADVLCKTSRDGHVHDLLLEACHEACTAAAADALASRVAATSFIVHIRSSLDAVVTALQRLFATASAVDSGMASSYEKLCVMVVSTLQPRLRQIVQGSVDAAAAAAAAAADSSSDDVTSNTPARSSSAAAAAIVDVSRALCSLACSFLALHPDAHFSEAGCRNLHEVMAGCVADAQSRVVQIETQRVLALVAAAGKASAAASAADAMDWLQSQPLDLLRLVADVACALHRCCGGCNPKQVAGLLLQCFKAIAALFKKHALQHYDLLHAQLSSDTSPPPTPSSKDKLTPVTPSNTISSSASWTLFRFSLRLIAAARSFEAAAAAAATQVLQAQLSAAAASARVNGMLDVAHAGEYCLASSSDAAAAAAAAAAANPVDVAAETQLVGDMEALLQRSFIAFARAVLAAVPKAGAWTTGSSSSYAPSPQSWATRLGEHVLALPEHLDGTAVGHAFSYPNELIEQLAHLIVAALSRIECINAPGLRQLHFDLDYVANCCSAVSTGAMQLKPLLEQTQNIALQLRSDVPAVAEALASLRRAYKE